MTVVAKWAEGGVRLTCMTLDIDFSGTVGQMIANTLFGFAEMFNKDRKRRQAAGIKVAKANGVYRGRKPGSTKAKPARVQELHGKGLSATQISEATGISTRTVWRYLKAPAQA
jgi:DNA invertase Pin-like site-specific DNA recombinase